MNLDDLQKAVDSETRSNQLLLEKGMPADFDFKIEDRVFTRKFNGERISVTVDTPNRTRYDDDDDDDDGGGGAPPSYNLVVNITKKKGETVTFNASVCDDEITVASMSAKLPTDDVWSSRRDNEEYIVNKEDNLQCALREHLKTRGITKPNTDFMYDYSARKSKLRPSIAPVLKSLQRFMKD